MLHVTARNLRRNFYFLLYIITNAVSSLNNQLYSNRQGKTFFSYCIQLSDFPIIEDHFYKKHQVYTNFVFKTKLSNGNYEYLNMNHVISPFEVFF